MQNPNEGVKTHFECDFCNKDNASMKCSKCRCAFYCSAECQAKHWKVEHKKACKEFCRHIANMESENLRISYYENDEVNECSLCMDPVGELPLELACKHQYCMMCVEENIPLNKPVEMQCPLCAEDLTKNVQRSVYDKAIRFCRMAFSVEHKEGKQDLLLKFIELAQLNFDLLKASAEKNNYPLEIDVRSIEVSILMLRKEFDSCISLALSILNQTPRPDEDLAMELMSSVATCYVRQKKYAEAKNAFTDMYRIISEPEKFPQVQRKIVFETSRCEYELGNYKRSIEIGELAVEMNRHYEDVYKYIILSFVALERIDLAMQVCKRAIRYEVPWDIEHRQKLEAQLKELQEKNKSEGKHFVFVYNCKMASHFVEMESMIPRADFEQKARCPLYINHEVFISVKQKNLDLLEEEVLRRSTPGSPLYQQWMTRAEVDEMKSNPEGGAAVAQFLTDHNVEITWSSRNQDYMKATTTIAHWENLLNTEFYMWEDLKGGESTNGEIGSPHLVPRAMRYSIPFEIAEYVHAFTGVTNLPSPLSQGNVRVRAPSHLDSSNDGDTRWERKLINDGTTIDFLNQYYNVESNTGSSDITQSVFETSDQEFSTIDLRKFQRTYGTRIQSPVVIGGHNVTWCTNTIRCSEGNLDIQYIMGMSQVTTSVYYYVGGNDPFIDWIVEVADSEHPPLVNSISWGSVEQLNPTSSMDNFNNEAMALAAMGITVLVSSGDDGVSNFYRWCTADSSGGLNSNFAPWSGEGYFPSFPATSPYVTAVGATMGPTDGDPEVACQADEGGVITSGGGFSSYYSMPSWQTEAVNTYFSRLSTPPAPGYNPQGRAYPDVSLIGVDYPVIINGLTYFLYGTSAASPVFAAFVSLLNADRLKLGLPPAGFLNPTLYSAGNNVTMPNATTPTFNDITVGVNKCTSGSDPSTVDCCSSGFYAATGWDPVTGWGSINYQQFSSIYGIESSNFKNQEAQLSAVQIFIILLICCGCVINSFFIFRSCRDRSNNREDVGISLEVATATNTHITPVIVTGTSSVITSGTSRSKVIPVATAVAL